MVNKKVLIITPFFSPESHAAMFRAHKLAKYLKRMGWQPYVITVATNYLYNEDPSLSEELEGIPIYRTKYVEPSIRGVRMALGGSDRTYKTLKSEGVFNTKGEKEQPLGHAAGVAEQSFKAKLYQYIQERYLKSPDRFWTWKKGATRMAKKLIKAEGIGTVFTTCLPFAPNQIGVELKKAMPHINWVADFRDPITHSKRYHSPIPKVYAKQRRIQDDTFRYADTIVGTSSSYGLIFHDQYAGDYDDKFAFIPTGLDDEYIPKPAKEKDNVLVFIGEYLKEYKDYFFKIYKKVIQELPPEDVPKINIIGNKEINQSQALQYVQDLDLSAYVTFYDHMPQPQLYERVERARYVLLINGDKSYWWCVFAKLIDYIALKKEVIAFIPEISEARKELTKAHTAHFLSFSDQSSAQKLKDLFLEKGVKKEPNVEYCKRYLASSQAEAFIDIFKKLQS